MIFDIYQFYLVTGGQSDLLSNIQIIKVSSASTGGGYLHIRMVKFIP
jgi:hypothetical protein